MARPKNPQCPVCGRKAHPDGIRHLPSGRYQARFIGPDKLRHTAVFQTTTDARAWLNAQQADISREKWKPASTVTAVSFADYSARWVTNRKVKGRPLGERTVAGYRDLLDRFILPTFGTRPVHTITREAVEKWYDATAVNAPTSRSHAYSLLRTVLASAVLDGHLAANPAQVRGAGSVERKHEVKPATLDELVTITASMPPRYRLLVQLAAWCALRFGELTELRRIDVDTREGVIRVRRGVVMVPSSGKFVVKSPKTRAGTRDVAIPPALLPLVRQHLLEHTAPGPDGLLFPSATPGGDEHLRQSSLARVYYPARQAAGRPDLRFHDLRHTGAVLAAQTGATIAELMLRLGHTTPATAMRYQSVAAGRDALIAGRLSDMIQAHASQSG